MTGKTGAAVGWSSDSQRVVLESSGPCRPGTGGSLSFTRVLNSAWPLALSPYSGLLHAVGWAEQGWFPLGEEISVY